MALNEIVGGDGLKLSVHEFGNPNGRPILFIHGLMQCSLSWSQQYESDLANEFRLICMDMRGHGMSERAASAEAYQDSKLWADDVAAVIDALELEKPILVGASYGGFPINDYVHHFGDAQLGGINYVASTVYFGNDKAEARLAKSVMELVPGLLSPDLAGNIAATRSFVRLFYATQPSQEQYETVLAYNMAVPVEVRAALAGREIDGDAIMESIKCPVLISHGTDDAIVLPAMSESIKERIPHAVLSLYEGVGHTPYGEAVARFNSELADFARKSGS
jgi:pimeloyl-ACP methyl ester carboxylesterase